MTDAELTIADGIVRTAKARGWNGYTLDIDFLLELIAELRKHRGIERKK